MVASAGRTDTEPCAAQFRGQDPALHRVGLVWVWRGVAEGLCVWAAAFGGPQCQWLGGLQPTSLPGDGFQVTGAGGQLAGVEPQAAAAVGGLLAGPGVDAVAGVLQGRERRGCGASIQPCPALAWDPLLVTASSLLCAQMLLRAPALRSLWFPFGVCVPHSHLVLLG